MQAQEATSDQLYHLWAWCEANLKTIAVAAGILVVVCFAFYFHSYQQAQKEIEAGQALTQAMISNTGGPLADACLKVASEYAGTAAGQRALFEGATELFTTGKYADAQTEFQKLLDSDPNSFFAPQAALGIAASMDALGKTDLAVSAYQKAAGASGNPFVVATAKFALARIAEDQGKTADAVKLYTEVARNFQRTSMGNEAGLRAMELRKKLPATPTPSTMPTTAPAALPFKLNN
jgi:TolA-binding protein